MRTRLIGVPLFVPEPLVAKRRAHFGREVRNLEGMKSIGGLGAVENFGGRRHACSSMIATTPTAYDVARDVAREGMTSSTARGELQSDPDSHPDTAEPEFDSRAEGESRIFKCTLASAATSQPMGESRNAGIPSGWSSAAPIGWDWSPRPQRDWESGRLGQGCRSPQTRRSTQRRISWAGESFRADSGPRRGARTNPGVGPARGAVCPAVLLVSARA